MRSPFASTDLSTRYGDAAVTRIRDLACLELPARFLQKFIVPGNSLCLLSATNAAYQLSRSTCKLRLGHSFSPSDMYGLIVDMRECVFCLCTSCDACSIFAFVSFVVLLTAASLVK